MALDMKEKNKVISRSSVTACRFCNVTITATEAVKFAICQGIIVVCVAFICGCQETNAIRLSRATPVVPVITNAVSLAWDASPTPEVIGYRVYHGAQSRSYTNSVVVGNVLAVTLTNLPPITNYFAATAYDAFGTESGFSNEIFRSTTNAMTVGTNVVPELTNRVTVIWVETNKFINGGAWNLDARFNTVRITNGAGPAMFIRIGFTNVYQ